MTLFGHKIACPAVGAPTGGTTYNMGAKMTEDAYIEAVIGGCAAAGTVGSVADGIGDPVEVYDRRLRKLSELGLKAIAGVKPRTQEEIIARMKKAEAAGAIAISMDIDSAGRAARALPGQTVEPKDTAKLRELVKATKLPFIVKGVMTVDEALSALWSRAPRRSSCRITADVSSTTRPEPPRCFRRSSARSTARCSSSSTAR